MRQLTKIFFALAAALATVAALGAAPAAAQFGLEDFQARVLNADGSENTQAGSHPFVSIVSFAVKTKDDPELGIVPDEAAKTVRFNLPPGFIGSRTAVPTCTTADFLTIDSNARNACPDNTAVGVTRVGVAKSTAAFEAAVYNLVPPPGVAVKLGFVATGGIPITVDVGLNTAAPTNVVSGAVNIQQAANFYNAEFQLWGVPADHAHDPYRGNCLNTEPGPQGQPQSIGICNTGAAQVPFVTLPRSCTGPVITSYEAVSWQHPDAEPVRGDFTGPAMTGCSKLSFAPGIAAKPTASSAESASGLDFSIDFKNEGLTNPSGLSQSDLKAITVTLPVGVTVNPSAANGLAVCSRAAYEAESLATGAGEGCPQASKIGDVSVQSQLLAEGETLDGSVFLASQDDNPFGSLVALYLVIKNRQLGVLVKQAGEVRPSESGANAGQLVTTFSDIPQVPFSHLDFHFSEGARGALVTPPACGTYTTQARLTPWADPAHPLDTTASFSINSGVGGGACPPGGLAPFKPGFEAGSLNNSAGAYSPFVMRLTRADGEQDMTRFDAVLPKGVIGKLAGVAQCPEAAVAAAKAKSGRAELANPSCPANSQIGRTLGGAGVGGVLTYVPGKLYLGGPFAGAPLSAIAITPAVAGPFDVGTVVVHEALNVNPETAEVEVDGARSDPIPHILKGIPLKLRDLRIYADRPNFTLNPTSCAKKKAKATLWGSFLDVFNPADDKPVSLSDRYQAASCASLKFKPNLALSLKGGTKRASHPALKGVLTYPKGAGYANIAKVVTTLPHSAFLDQAHIRTVCTRVQFAAKKCPPGSIYGKARATTPLLDEPLAGPVYLRSSNHPLPDLVIALHGIVDFNLVGRVDSVNGGIRVSFESAPDAPVSKFVLEMRGGKKGLIINSRNLCAHQSRAKVAYTAQNGKTYEQKPVVKASCKKR